MDTSKQKITIDLSNISHIEDLLKSIQDSTDGVVLLHSSGSITFHETLPRDMRIEGNSKRGNIKYYSVNSVENDHYLGFQKDNDLRLRHGDKDIVKRKNKLKTKVIVTE